MTKEKKDQASFESKVKRLEEIVSIIESSEVDLEESIKLFEEGMRLSKECQKSLDAAEKKVQVLMTDESGHSELKDFND